MVASVGVSDSRSLNHAVAVPCGSMSKMRDRFPFSCAATAQQKARVVLPEPPFWVTNEITRIWV